MKLSVSRPSTEKPTNQVKLSDFQTDQPTVRVNFNLTEQQRMKLKKYALEQNKTMTEIVANFIDRLDER